MYEIITLPNGVRIAHEKMSGVRSAAVGIWVGVGSRYEKRGEEGSAHFIEHMLFKGTAHSTAAAIASSSSEVPPILGVTIGTRLIISMAVRNTKNPETA